VQTHIFSHGCEKFAWPIRSCHNVIDHNSITVESHPRNADDDGDEAADD